MSGYDLNSNASLNLDASLSFLYGCTWNSKIACTINKKSAKLIAIHNIPLPHAHIIIYCNKLNSGCFLSTDSVNVNKSRKMNILLLSKNHLHTFIISAIMSLDILLTLFTHSTSITLCKFVWDLLSNTLKPVNERVTQLSYSIVKKNMKHASCVIGST